MKSSQNKVASIETKIYVIRGQKVMLDFDLAELYEVPTMRLNQQVRRNDFRFPADFMFVLTNQEFGNLKSQFVISSSVKSFVNEAVSDSCACIDPELTYDYNYDHN